MKITLRVTGPILIAVLLAFDRAEQNAGGEAKPAVELV